MTKMIQRYIKNWNKPYAVLFSECQQALFRVFEKCDNAEDFMTEWQVVSENAPLIAFALLKYFDKLGKECDDQAILDCIRNTIEIDTPNNESKMAEILVLSALMGKSLPAWTTTYLANSENSIYFYINALEIIDSDFLGDREHNLLLLITFLYKNNDDDETLYLALKQRRYSLNKHELNEKSHENLIQLISKLIFDGRFRLAYQIIQIYGVRYNELTVLPEQIYEKLRSSNDKTNFYRGGLIYRKMLEDTTDDKIEALKKWYSDVKSLNTDAACEEKNYFRFLYMFKITQENCKQEVCQIDGGFFKSESDNNIKHRPQFIGEYRETVYCLLKYCKIQQCSDFIKYTEQYNIDGYTSADNAKLFQPKEIREQIGLGSESEMLLKNLSAGASDAATAVYIFMNSFMRSLIVFGDFIDEIYKRFGNDVIIAMKSYEFKGLVNFDSEIGIYYYVPIKIRRGAKYFIHKESERNVLNNICDPKCGGGFADKQFITRLSNYNPENRILSFSILGYGKQRLQDLSEKLDLFIYNHENVDALTNSIKDTKIGFVERDDEDLVNICIKELAAIISCSPDREKIHKTVGILASVNYYMYYPDHYDKTKLRQKITSDQHRQIDGFWNKLIKSKLSVKECFYIYRNTIFRRKYCLSQFMGAFVENDSTNYASFFRMVGELNGLIQIIPGRTSTDSMLILLAPIEFQNYRGGAKYDQYKIEFPLMGQSERAFRKKYRVKSHVKFKIESYDGKGVFMVKW